MKWISSRQISDEGESGNSSKSGAISFSVISGFLTQFLLDYIVPKSWKGLEYFAFKVFLNNLIFVILLPFVMILTLTNLNKFCRQYLTSVFANAKSIHPRQLWKKSYESFKMKNNRVSPDIDC